jgi:ABC-2 type transport system ATP-binding protein
MSAVVELKHVTKTYSSNTALSDVTLEVPPGVVFALLGENGAGKTTAIRLMLGLTEPTHGEVRVLVASQSAAASAICPSARRFTNG